MSADSDNVGIVTNPRLAPLAPKQAAQAKKASRCLHDRRPSRQPPSPIGRATPFFRHLARPREAENQERERVVRNSVIPSGKELSLENTSRRLESPDNSVRILVCHLL